MFLFDDSRVASVFLFVFFFNATAPTGIYTLSLHDALPISKRASGLRSWQSKRQRRDEGLYCLTRSQRRRRSATRSEEHTSELQSRFDLVCRLLLEKKNRERFEITETSPVTHHKPIKVLRQI